jgi:hypothetical protein
MGAFYEHGVNHAAGSKLTNYMVAAQSSRVAGAGGALSQISQGVPAGCGEG